MPRLPARRSTSRARSRTALIILASSPSGPSRMIKAVLERALDVEIADHLGYEPGDPAGIGSGNSRNGHGRKTVHTTAGPVELEVPRDRNGSFTPGIVPSASAGWATWRT